VRGLELGERRIHLASELFEDALRGWGLSTDQDASDRTRLLEAPSPLVLVVVVVPSWWRQRGKTGIALGAILTRRVPPGALARLVLPAVLMRPVTPLLAWASVIPASTSASASSSTAVAPVVALGASTKASFPYVSELLTVAGVVGVQVVEGAKRTALLGRLWLISASLGVGLRCEHHCLFVLHVLGLGLLLLHSCS